ncbi:uncharacterized protein LOC127789030 [Diospyros lotus]|uniref:uncharacterized protein LOC127789030 n=1 Tax=Diospyros lotus TaxID=55363 RepID=UPI0022570858|nr:uncharacterized protein LOC127789030 [Diospyros lotus]
MEGKDLQEIEHPGHDHRLLLRESLQGGDRYGHQVYCDGCREPISSSSSGVEGGGGAFYACPNSDCWFLLHKRCAELPPKIEHPSHPDHALTLSPFPVDDRECDVCDFSIDGFLYHCSDCDFDVHVRCASMAVHIQDRVDENKKIHKHPLIPLEKEALFICDVCGREHMGKSYLCPTCGFWANQICASAPTTVDLHSHPHPLTLFRSFRYDGQICETCNFEVNRACWAYFCSEGCKYSVHVGCLPLEEAENCSNKDIEANLHLKSSRSHEIEIPTGLKEEIILITWPVPDESAQLITQLIKNLSLQETHYKRAIEIPCCQRDHSLIFVNKKIDESKDDQLCNGCAQTISSQFYYCAQCKFSLHKWCAELPNELQHILHPEHPLHLRTQQDMYYAHTYCTSCRMHTNGFTFSCSTCDFYLDLKCASLPRLIKHQLHDHNLVLRKVSIIHPCKACGLDEFYTSFRCEPCNFKLCILCALLPFSVRHRYDKHPFTLTYSPIEGEPNDYYCEICEEDINSMCWFYHCIKCDQSLHPKCIHPPIRSMIVKFGAQFEVNFHSHLLRFVRRPKGGLLAPCHNCGCRFGELDYMAFECEQCDFWRHHDCGYRKGFY